MSNRLIHEKSPYLLQHANNPVDWHPWGDEAFQKARREDKPIFLSVGYSTCHWCHVMERESFESNEIASILNDRFVPIKVDREERPDIDHVYMTFVQVISRGGGGWPMSVFLTPDLKPFFGGTYFPPESRYGQPGFKDVLIHLGRMWSESRDKVITSGNEVMQLLERANRQTATTGLDEQPLLQGYRYFQESYDRKAGGFDGAPKFPRPSVFNFLLRTRRADAIEMTATSLLKMGRGGIHDHLGGGFHRYAVDQDWHVPHFEKMLYDQAQLAISYLEAYRLTGNQELKDNAQDIVEYVLRDMRHAEGGFFSAEDADSAIDAAHPEEKGEGAFYVWEAKEIDAALDAEEAAIFKARYGVQPGGNVLHDPHGEFDNKNILHVKMDLDVLSHKTGVDMSRIPEILERSRQKLLAIRSKRPRPHLDDKVLTSWNGLMISAVAKAYEVTEERRYLDAANLAADFVLGKMWQPPELKRRFRDGDVGIEAQLDDYAFFIAGLLDLYEASFDDRRMDQALALHARQIELFWEEKDGAFFDTTGRDASVLLRSRGDYDGAEPAAGSIATLNLLRISSITDDEALRSMAQRSLALAAARPPAAIPQMLVALDFYLSPPIQIVLAGSDTRDMLREINRHFIPHRILLHADLHGRIPALAEMRPHDGKATAYVCEHFSCKAPTTDVTTLSRLIA